MKYINILSLLFSILFISCQSKPEQPENEVKPAEENPICDNMRYLLAPTDTLKLIDIPFYQLCGKMDSIANQYFDSSFCCQYIHFLVNHKLDSNHKLTLELQYYYDCGNCGLHLGTRDHRFLLLTAEDLVLFDDAIIHKDSLIYGLKEYFIKVKNGEYSSPAKLIDVSLIVSWDAFVTQESFNNFFNQIIESYWHIASIQSQEQFGKDICDLNKNELEALAKEVPFKVHIPKIEIISDDINIDSE